MTCRGKTTTDRFVMATTSEILRSAQDDYKNGTDKLSYDVVGLVGLDCSAMALMAASASGVVVAERCSGEWWPR